LVPFYNYFQAACVMNEDGLLSAEALLRVGTDLVLQHRFDGDALVRSYLDLAKRGHVRGKTLDAIEAALDKWPVPSRRSSGGAFGLDEVHAIGRRIGDMREAASRAPEREPIKVPDYYALVMGHNRRRR
jgi:hypothetical protein